MRLTAIVVLTALAGLLAGCGGDADLTVYSGRSEELIGDLVEDFEEESGLSVEVRYGDSAELAATILEEGENTPADVFFAQDAGSLGSVGDVGLLRELPESVLGAVDEEWHDPDGLWVGTSGRARVVAYNTDEFPSEDALPDSIWEYADPSWRGRLGVAPTNASFQAMVTAMRLDAGDERTREWLQAIVANEPLVLENNIQTVEAVASGEIDAGFVNHYYLYGVLEEQPDAPVRNLHLAPGDAGSLVNVAGAGILRTTDKPRGSEQFVQYLLGEGQRYFAAETSEYPLAGEVEPKDELPPLDELQGPDIRLGALGPELEETLRMLNEVGLTP